MSNQTTDSDGSESHTNLAVEHEEAQQDASFDQTAQGSAAWGLGSLSRSTPSSHGRPSVIKKEFLRLTPFSEGQYKKHQPELQDMQNKEPLHCKKVVSPGQRESWGGETYCHVLPGSSPPGVDLDTSPYSTQLDPPIGSSTLDNLFDRSGEDSPADSKLPRSEKSMTLSDKSAVHHGSFLTRSHSLEHHSGDDCHENKDIDPKTQDYSSQDEPEEQDQSSNDHPYSYASPENPFLRLGLKTPANFRPKRPLRLSAITQGLYFKPIPGGLYKLHLFDTKDHMLDLAIQASIIEEGSQSGYDSAGDPDVRSRLKKSGSVSPISSASSSAICCDFYFKHITDSTYELHHVDEKNSKGLGTQIPMSAEGISLESKVKLRRPLPDLPGSQKDKDGYDLPEDIQALSRLKYGSGGIPFKKERPFHKHPCSWFLTIVIVFAGVASSWDALSGKLLISCTPPAGFRNDSTIKDTCWIDPWTLVGVQLYGAQVLKLTLTPDYKHCNWSVIDNGYSASGVTCDTRQGRFYVTDYTINHTVRVYKDTGEKLEVWHPANMSLATAITNNHEYLGLIPQNGNNVSLYQILGDDWSFVTNISVGEHSLDHIAFIHLTEKNLLLSTAEIYGVVDDYMYIHDLVTKKEVRVGGKKGSGEAELDRPRGISDIPDTDAIIVCDQNNHRLQVFSHEGDYLHTIKFVGGDVTYPYSISITQGRGKSLIMAISIEKAKTNNIRIYSLF